jgi:hypothetical protein
VPFDANQRAQVSDTLADPNQVNLYGLQLHAGDEVVADVTDQSLGNPASCLRIFNSAGQQLAVQANTGTLDTQQPFDASENGAYYVGVSSLGNLGYDPNTSASGSGGAATGSYVLNLTLLSSIPVARAESTSNGLPANLSFPSAQTITGSTVLHGTYLSSTTEYYSFTAPATGGLSVSVTAADRTAFLPRLTLFGAAEQLLIQSDAGRAGNGSAQLNQHLQPGTYYLGITSVTDFPVGNRSYVLATSFRLALPAFQDLPAGANPFSVAVGDLNHDGNLDIVTANAFGGTDTGTVSVFLGNGDGTFQPAVSYRVGMVPHSVSLGDFANNGNLDIVTADTGSNTVSVLLGNGNGTFQPAKPYSIQDTSGKGQDPEMVAVGDIRGDGNLDIVTANSGDSTVSVLLGSGHGTFQPAVTYSIQDASGKGSDPQAVAVGDLNGNLDIVTANSGDDTVSVLLGNGSGAFQQPAVTYSTHDSSGNGQTPNSLVLGDFSKKGKLDIATANQGDGTVSVLLGNGNGTFQPAVTYQMPGDTGSVALGQLTPDGALDIVTADEGDSTVSVLLGRGDGTFLPDGVYPVGNGPLSVATAPFTHDGNRDIVTANFADNTVSVLLGRGDGTFQHAPFENVGSGAVALAVGDFNQDGNLDIVTANQNDDTVSVLLGRGDGTFAPSATYSVHDAAGNGLTPDAVAVGDFNADGNLDIVTANYDDNTVSVLLGRGDGSFLPAVTYAVGQNPDAVAVGDMNGDGKLDIVTANFGENTVSLLLGNGDGTFQPALTYHVGPTPDAIALGHLSRNGHLDIVTANNNHNAATGGEGRGSVSVLLGNGDGTFQPAVTYDVGHDPTSVAVGALGGYPYIATSIFDDANGETVSVLLGKGDGTFGNAKPYVVGNAPTSVAVGDFNHSGLSDIVAAVGIGAVGNSVSLLRANADGTFVLAGTYPTYQPSALAVGDLNNHGNPDIAILNSNDTVSVLLDKGADQFQIATPANSIAIRNTPYLQDLTGDGIPDELILNSSGDLLFRQGLAGSSNEFAPPLVVNAGRPARDVTLVQIPETPLLGITALSAGSWWGPAFTGPTEGKLTWAIAAVDRAGNAASIYAWIASKRSFQRIGGFATGNLPVRIASADLNGDGRGDLVVANSFDNSVTIAIQGSSTVMTYPVGSGPSGIMFANLGGDSGPDIVVSDSVSGDFSVLHNDPAHTFSQQSRYRAGSGLFDIDNSTGQQTIVSPLQTVGIVADDFTGSHADDLIALNRGAKSFTLFPNQGQGSFAAPQSANTYFPTSDQPGQIVSLTLPGHTLPSVAVLMQDLGQIWLYRNNDGSGNTTFAAPVPIPAGNDPTGFSVATVQGKPALLVGNPFGDILTLLYDGKGSFAPDTAALQNMPLAVGTVPGTGQQYAVVADPQLDKVSVYFRKPGTNQFESPVPISSQTQPLLAPGAVQLFTVPGNPNPYLAVADNLGNKILVYPGLAGGQFGPPTPYPVGDDPRSITVADINNDGVPDLLVANYGSNDVSVLIGSTTAGSWSATAYQRLKSDGFGPISVAVVNAIGSSDAPAATGETASGNPFVGLRTLLTSEVGGSTGSGGASLLVTNSSGTTSSDGMVALLPAIGTNGLGSGFFRDINPQTFDLNSTVVQALSDPTTGQLFVVGGDGGVSVLTAAGFQPFFKGKDVTALAAIDDFLVAGFTDGSLGLLSASGALLASEPTGFNDSPSALEALQNGDVFVTLQGNDVPVIVSLELPVPLVTGLPAYATVSEGTTVPGFSSFFLVATLLPGRFAESTSVQITAESQINGMAGIEDDTDPLLFTAVVALDAPDHADMLGTNEALRERLEQQRMHERIEEVMDIFMELINQARELLDVWPAVPARDMPPPAEPRSKPPERDSREMTSSPGQEQAAMVAPEDSADCDGTESGPE